MTTLFAADIHLSTARPDRVKAFTDFLLGPCQNARALYLLGDVFDVWLGDDDERAPHLEVSAALTALTGGGTPVYFMTGNHDLLVGDAFFKRTGCRPISEPHFLQIHDHRVVLLHGDAMCTHDKAYQAWRKTFTDPANQRAFLALGFEQRLAQAAQLRMQSNAHTALSTAEIMDVSPDAVLDTLTQAGATHMIHGHTHRPAIHVLENNGDTGARIVLGDWYQEEKILAWDAAGYRLGSIRQLHL